jgi:hypothetical protein
VTSVYFLSNTIQQPSSVTYQWHADGLQIIGATNQMKCIVKAVGGPATLFCRAYDGCSENGNYYVEGSFSINTDCWTLALYPNPASEYVEVSIVENNNEVEDFNNECEIRVFDNLKHQVKYSKTNLKSIRVEVSDLISGIYHIQVKYKDKVEVQQIIITK